MTDRGDRRGRRERRRVVLVELARATPEHARGRIFASFDMFWQLGRLVSLLIGGLLAAAVGIAAVYCLGGALLLLAAAIGWTGLRRRNLGLEWQRSETNVDADQRDRGPVTDQ